MTSRVLDSYARNVTQAPARQQPMMRLPFLAPLVHALVAAPVLAVLQAVLGGRRRWNLLQVAVTAGAAGVPHLAVGRVFARPLALTWAYGLGTRVLAPAHWRSLQFWRRVLPIYLAYKRTQVMLCLRRAGRAERDRVFAKRHEWAAERVYNMCVTLRGFFLKNGQYLGSRRDFIPAAWCDALRRLQDRVPPVPFAEIEETLKSSYKINKTSQLFNYIDPRPLASATIAQVHRGAMLNGTEIALKTQYMDQQRLCAMDLRNLKRLVRYLQAHDLSFFDMQSVVRELEVSLPTEFNFVRESEMMTTVRLNLRKAGISDIVVPTAIPGLVSPRSLCMTFIDGCRPDNTVAMNLWGIKPKRILRAIGRAYGQMLLVDGLAHCDPHLGNLIILRDGRVALIDFGQTKEIPRDLRHKLCAFYLAVCAQDNVQIMKTFGELDIELDIMPKDMDEKFYEKVPTFANGLLDTAPLPTSISMNPFAKDSPLQAVPIKRFNSDLFMILQTMGLLRSLSDTLRVDSPDCWMSNLFRPYAKRGISHMGPSDIEKNQQSALIRASLTSGVASPFETQPDWGDSCLVG